MFSTSAELYDLIYSGFKDYGKEAAQIAAAIRSAHSGARQALDVACGTGEHARLLTEAHGWSQIRNEVDPLVSEKLCVFADVTDWSSRLEDVRVGVHP